MIEINWFLLLTQIGTFLAAMVIVWKLFWGPLTLFMQARTKRIAEDVSRAEKGRHEIEAMEAEYRLRLSEVEEHARQEIQDALTKGNQAKEDLLAEARTEARQILEKAQADLVLERERVLRELRAQMTDMSLAAVERLIGQGLDQKAQRRLLDQFLDDMDKVGPVA